ncbi:MAG: alpha/beta fold hydrolase [Proteobacteria bacterium]|jgi:pimeloyl-ACP methyl ester carboxylesterase|nr:alpha/beta fold hydrolase [Pseudomonadota bacterium]MDA1298556.1 alpha/beta fold hydrolase [Pseudomonadota bacterium]
MDQIEIEARGLTFSAHCDGPADGPVIIMLHGLPRTSWEWHHQMRPLARMGYRTIAPDLRGFCPGARPAHVEAYVISEFMADVLAIADVVASEGAAFHLMGTSIGAVVSWRVAAANPERVRTLVCINIPHPGALAEIAQSDEAAEQALRMSYMENSRKEGNERATFERSLNRMGLPEDETNPYREALGNDAALRTVYHWYRAIDIDPDRGRLPPPVTMPTLFLWPPGAGNVSRASAEANRHYVAAPYRFEILENAFNYALQMEPERITALLVEHLSEHDRED